MRFCRVCRPPVLPSFLRLSHLCRWRHYRWRDDGATECFTARVDGQWGERGWKVAGDRHWGWRQFLPSLQVNAATVCHQLSIDFFSLSYTLFDRTFQASFSADAEPKTLKSPPQFRHRENGRFSPGHRRFMMNF